MTPGDVDELLVQAQPGAARRLDRRELATEIALSVAVLAAAIAWPVSQDVAVPWGAAGACVLAYAAAASVVLFVGAGCALATQLAFVPMLWVLPPALVPGCVVIALGLWALPDILFRGHPPQRFLTAVGNAGYAFAPAVVFALAAEPSWTVVAIAFGAQCAFDAVLSVAREWIGRGIAPAVQLAVMGSVYGVDALLAPVAVVIAEATADAPAAVLSVIPLAGLLAALARERTRRISESAERLERLRRERERVDVAIHRVGRSLVAGHDRIALMEVAVGTAVDAVAAAAGRARLVGIPQVFWFEAVPRVSEPINPTALERAEHVALAGRRPASAFEHGWHALACPLRVHRDGAETIIGALSVCRQAAFSSGEEILLDYLATQTAATIRSSDLDDRLRSELSRDPQTGVANRARFRDVLTAELERSVEPLALLLIGLDGFERLAREDVDRVVRAAGAVVRERARWIDEPARIRSDRFGIVLPGASVDDARAIADDIRAGIAAGGRLTASAGIACRGDGRDTREALLLAAELALERAQRAGGARTVVFEPVRAPSSH